MHLARRRPRRERHWLQRLTECRLCAIAKLALGTTSECIHAPRGRHCRKVCFVCRNIHRLPCGRCTLQCQRTIPDAERAEGTDPMEGGSEMLHEEQEPGKSCSQPMRSTLPLPYNGQR